MRKASEFESNIYFKLTNYITIKNEVAADYKCAVMLP